MRCSPTAFMSAPSARSRQPGFFVYRPVKPTGLAMLVIPGGGYAAEGGDRGGREIARYFADRGIIAFVLRYRLPGEGWKNREMVPLQDAQRAMRLIRAGEYGAGRLGVIGFSAGGHLSATLALRSGMPTYEAVSAADRGSARPDHRRAHVSGHHHGRGRPSGLARQAAGDHRPRRRPSPTGRWNGMSAPIRCRPIICLAADDDVVPPMPNGIAFFGKLQEAKMPSQMRCVREGRSWLFPALGARQTLRRLAGAVPGLGGHARLQGLGARPAARRESAPGPGSGVNGPDRRSGSACPV